MITICKGCRGTLQLKPYPDTNPLIKVPDHNEAPHGIGPTKSAWRNKNAAGGINPPAALNVATTVEGLVAKLQGQLDGSRIIGAGDFTKVAGP